MAPEGSAVLETENGCCSKLHVKDSGYKHVISLHNCVCVCVL